MTFQSQGRARLRIRSRSFLKGFFRLNNHQGLSSEKESENLREEENSIISFFESFQQ
jgi:hypothetical protein